MNSNVTCLHCGYAVIRGNAPRGTIWIHEANLREECRPTFAAPVFPTDPTWTAPRRPEGSWLA